MARCSASPEEWPTAANIDDFQARAMRAYFRHRDRHRTPPSSDDDSDSESPAYAPLRELSQAGSRLGPPGVKEGRDLGRRYQDKQLGMSLQQRLQSLEFSDDDDDPVASPCTAMSSTKARTDIPAKASRSARVS